MPEQSPDWRAVLSEAGESVASAMTDEEVMQIIRKANEKYYYWNKVRSQPLSAPYSKELVWACLKLQRETQLQPLPLQAKGGHPLRYWLPEPLPELLQRIDRATEGLILESPGSGKQHLIRSLMEEAITSSQLEGATTTMRDAKKMLLSGRKPRNESERMIFNSYETMQLLKELSGDGLTPQLILDIHHLITRDTLADADQGGRYRRTDEFVRIENHQGDILFEPPPADRIEQEIAQLCAFANEPSNIHPVIRAIILHFYLAYLHPFVDGNGRTARALFYWYLLKQGYWYLEYMSISKMILKRLTQYGRAYLYVERDEGDITYFIHFHLRIITAAIEDLRNYLAGETDEAFAALAEFPDLNLRQSRLILDLVRQPKRIITVKQYQTTHAVAYQTARSDLLDLTHRGLLQKIEKGRTFHFILAMKTIESLLR